MPARATDRRYHHGALRAALIEVAIAMIEEEGYRAFSMAAASRRLKVAVSAPYAHFRDREDLLAAVAINGWALFSDRLAAELEKHTDPAAQLAGIADCYIRFAGEEQPMFEVLFLADVDKGRHPEIAVAEQPLVEAVVTAVGALTDDERTATELVEAIEATAHGFAIRLIEGDYGPPADNMELTAARAAATTRALISARALLGRGSP